jgi:hypothetical protein
MTAQNRVNSLFLRGCWRGEMVMMMLMMRWEPLCHHRTVRQQHWVMKNLSPDSVFIVLPLYQPVRCNPNWVLSSQLDLLLWTGFTIIRIFCDCGIRIKTDFCIYRWYRNCCSCFIPVSPVQGVTEDIENHLGNFLEVSDGINNPLTNLLQV